MNREIKFRAWDGDEMVILENAGLQYFDFEGSYALSFVVDGYSGFWAHEQYESASKKANKFPIMQFTGLKDKNGKDIYEGDIVENDGIAVVRYKGNQFVIESPGSLAIDYVSEYFFETCIVIGNQFQNPELLS